MKQAVRAVAVVVLAMLLSPSALAQSTPNLNGTWLAGFADSLGWGEIELKLKQNPNGEVKGTYKTSMGARGKVRGLVKGGELEVKLDQGRGCRGAFNTRGRIFDDRVEGTYVGIDCIGDHGQGRFSFLRANKNGNMEIRTLLPLPVSARQDLLAYGSGREETYGVRETTAGSEVDVRMLAIPGAVFARISVKNLTGGSLGVTPSKFFLLGPDGSVLHRYGDYELRFQILRTAGVLNLPKYNPPPPRTYYSLRMSSSGQYTIQNLGNGYYGMSGFTTSYGTAFRSRDYSPGVGYAVDGIFSIVQKIRQKARMARAEAQVRAMEKAYFKDQDLLLPSRRKGSWCSIRRRPSRSPLSDSWRASRWS